MSDSNPHVVFETIFISSVLLLALSFQPCASALVIDTPVITRRMLDFINASSEDPVVYLSQKSKVPAPTKILFAIAQSWPPVGALFRAPSSFRGVRNRSFNKKKTDKSYWILSVMFPCARNVLAPTHNMSFVLTLISFLSHFAMFVLFLLFCFTCLCVCVPICFCCVSTPPLLCLQPALSVSTHPSDLIPSCMPSPYTPLHLTAWQSITVAVTWLCLIDTRVTLHCVASKWLFTNCVYCLWRLLVRLLTQKTCYTRSVSWFDQIYIKKSKTTIQGMTLFMEI